MAIFFDVDMRTTHLSIILIIILGFAVYGNALNGEFIWDDEHLVKDNVYIKSPSHITKIFTKQIAASIGDRYNFYRPLLIFTFMIDYSLWKLDVRGYHLSNILLHILVALSIFWLMNILYNDQGISLLTSLFFLVHPIHTEAIAYISGRADPLAAILMLLCFILYINEVSSKRIGVYTLMLLSYILALLSRENSLILPALLLLYHYTFKKKLLAKKFLPILSIAFIYILLRLTALKFLLPHISCPFTVFERMPGFFVAITNYTRLMFLPFNLHMEYVNRLFQLTNLQVIAGMFILFSLLIYAFRKRDGNRLVFFSIAWLFITLLPVSNLYPLNAYMAEHWLYIPSIGFFLLLAKGLSFLYRRRGFRIVAILSIIGLLIFYSFLTIRQNAYWREPLVFYERTLRYAPDSSRMYNNLGFIYYATDRNQEALAAYKRAIEINPDYAETYNNLAAIYKNINKNKEAIASLRKAIEINPGYAEAYNNLGLVYYNTNKNQEAIAAYKKAIEINPDLAKAYNNLGSVYYAVNKNQEAITAYKKAIEINPDLASVYNNLGNVYFAVNKNKEAIALYKEAIEINPGLAEAYNNLGNVYFAVNKNQEAVAAYKKANAANPGYVDAYYSLGRVYYTMNKNKEAIASLNKAIEINPNYAKAYISLSIIYFQEKQYKLAIEYYDRAEDLGLANPALSENLKPYKEQEQLDQ